MNLDIEESSNQAFRTLDYLINQKSNPTNQHHLTAAPNTPHPSQAARRMLFNNLTSLGSRASRTPAGAGHTMATRQRCRRHI